MIKNDNMEIDFLKALKYVLEDMVRTGREYEISKIEKIAPQYAGAIYSMLIEKNTATATLKSLVVKPNGNLELLLEKTKGELADKEQKKEDHAFNRRKDYITIGVSIAALVISIVSIIISCSR